MSIAKTTTLAIGASLIGSSLAVVLEKPAMLSLTILITGIICLLHGTGFIQECVIRKFLRWYRTKKPLIAIIKDLPWSDYGHVWSKMSPDKWLSQLDEKLSDGQNKINVKLVKITNPWTRWFLDRYSVILNPYGPKYPESNIENLAIMKSILNYIGKGGVFVNVADIPFFFPFDKERKILYCPTRTDSVAHYYKVLKYKIIQIIEPKETKEFKEPSPGYDSLFSKLVMVDVFGTEVNIFDPQRKKVVKTPIRSSLKVKDKEVTLENVIIHRAIISTDHVKSIVEELEWDGLLFTPFCCIHYGRGKILASLIWLDHQPDGIKEKIIDLLCDLIVGEVKYGGPKQ
jgi:uncharacterized membrane protein